MTKEYDHNKFTHDGGTNALESRVLAERKPVAWVERWHGSAPQRGWSIMQGRHVVAYIGGDESMSDAVSTIVKAHNDCFDCEGTRCTMNCSGLRKVYPNQEAFSTDGESSDIAIDAAMKEQKESGT